MCSALVLWFALLHAFSLAIASTAMPRDNAGGRLGAHLETSTASWIGPTADVPTSGIRVPLRVPLRGARVDVWRAGTPVAHGKSGSALAPSHPLHSLPAPFLRLVRGKRAETHRLDARASLLPYFPTAPPRRA